MKQAITGHKYVCDGCARMFLVPKGEESPLGFYGDVRDTNTGMVIDFFACSPDCLRTAPENALTCAYREERE